MALTDDELKQLMDAIAEQSTGLEDMEQVSSLSGVTSLPGQKENALVRVPISLLSRLADEAAARANKAAEYVEGVIPGMLETTQNATAAATKAEEAATKANEASSKVQRTTGAAVGGATARFAAWVAEGNVVPDKATKAGGKIVYVASAKSFAYYVDSTFYGSWDVENVPPTDMYMNADLTKVLPDKIYILGDVTYTGGTEGLSLLAYRHKLMTDAEFEALEEKEEGVLYLTYEAE